MNDANDSRNEHPDDDEIICRTPAGDRLEAYMRAQLAAAGEDRQGRRRVISAVSVALLHKVRGEWLARVDRLLSQFAELESGADPSALPPIAKAFYATLEASDATCEHYATPTRTKPEWRTCVCPVCSATRAFYDRFDTEIELEALLENAVAVAYGGDMDRDDDWAVRRIFEAVGETSFAVPFDDRVYDAALAALKRREVKS